MGKRLKVLLGLILITACSVLEQAAADPSIVQESENKSSNLNFIYVDANYDSE